MRVLHHVLFWCWPSSDRWRVSDTTSELWSSELRLYCYQAVSRMKRTIKPQLWVASLHLEPIIILMLFKLKVSSEDRAQCFWSQGVETDLPLFYLFCCLPTRQVFVWMDGWMFESTVNLVKIKRQFCVHKLQLFSSTVIYSQSRSLHPVPNCPEQVASVVLISRILVLQRHLVMFRVKRADSSSRLSWR